MMGKAKASRTTRCYLTAPVATWWRQRAASTCTRRSSAEGRKSFQDIHGTARPTGIIGTCETGFETRSHGLWPAIQVTSHGLWPDCLRCRKRHGFLALSSLSSLCRIMSCNHHDLCSAVLAQGDLRRALCVAALRTDGQHVVPLWLSSLLHQLFGAR